VPLRGEIGEWHAGLEMTVANGAVMSDAWSSRAGAPVAWMRRAHGTGQGKEGD
jgi:hypothetical protein